MKKLLSLRIGWACATFALLDLFCTGAGMGVPIFCILFGLPVGWYITQRVTLAKFPVREMIGKILGWGAMAAAFTLLLMGILWGPSLTMLFDPQADLVNFGIPQILYTPKASFVGWMVLMILISPFLQFLMIVFGSNISLLWLLRREGNTG
ncbi:MAG: hypothetical protein JXA42_15980 [Anaerolineales bacterium]|nr:hypothetical protein [Anaerolineales bacterium]